MNVREYIECLQQFDPEAIISCRSLDETACPTGWYDELEAPDYIEDVVVLKHKWRDRPAVTQTTKRVVVV